MKKFFSLLLFFTTISFCDDHLYFSGKPFYSWQKESFISNVTLTKLDNDYILSNFNDSNFNFYDLLIKTSESFRNLLYGSCYDESCRICDYDDGICRWDGDCTFKTKYPCPIPYSVGRMYHSVFETSLYAFVTEIKPGYCYYYDSCDPDGYRVYYNEYKSAKRVGCEKNENLDYETFTCITCDEESGEYYNPEIGKCTKNCESLGNRNNRFDCFCKKSGLGKYLDIEVFNDNTPKDYGCELIDGVIKCKSPGDLINSDVTDIDCQIKCEKGKLVFGNGDGMSDICFSTDSKKPGNSKPKPPQPDNPDNPNPKDPNPNNPNNPSNPNNPDDPSKPDPDKPKDGKDGKDGNSGGSSGNNDGSSDNNKTTPGGASPKGGDGNSTKGEPGGSPDGDEDGEFNGEGAKKDGRDEFVRENEDTIKDLDKMKEKGLGFLDEFKDYTDELKGAVYNLIDTVSKPFNSIKNPAGGSCPYVKSFEFFKGYTTKIDIDPCKFIAMVNSATYLVFYAALFYGFIRLCFWVIVNLV
ncbi:MAG: hypothetical protein MR902_08010 [Campylobacter sp.]|nr:hypothetical protein [Campylobacter sp.]